jgi:hypothetical protein
MEPHALGIAGYSGQFLSPRGLVTLMQAFRADGTDATISVVQIDGEDYSIIRLGGESRHPGHWSHRVQTPLVLCHITVAQTPE